MTLEVFILGTLNQTVSIVYELSRLSVAWGC